MLRLILHVLTDQQIFFRFSPLNSDCAGVYPDLLMVEYVSFHCFSYFYKQQAPVPNDQHAPARPQSTPAAFAQVPSGMAIRIVFFDNGFEFYA